jgi:hypothetical protein
MIPYSKYI